MGLGGTGLRERDPGVARASAGADVTGSQAAAPRPNHSDVTSPWSEPLRSHIAVVGTRALGRDRDGALTAGGTCDNRLWSVCLGSGKSRELRGAAAGEDAVGQGQAADVGAGAQAGRAAAGRVQAVDRGAVGA